MSVNLLRRKKIIKKIKSFFKNIRENERWQLAILLATIFIIILSSAVIVAVKGKLFPSLINFTHRNPIININEYKDKKEKKKTEENATIAPRRLDGLIVSKEESNKLPICVMIENAAFSGVRPQSGISSASLVYEIIVEGGITRLMAVYAGEKADPIGPVRSARDTYLEFASELDCMYTHAGGSYTASKALWELHMKDLDGLREPKYFWRDPNKVSPHNYFTNITKLEQAAIFGHSWKDAPTYESWKFKDDNQNRKKAGEAGYVSKINIDFGGSYNVEYRFNYENNNYERINGGVEHTDANTGKVLTTRNIIIEKVPPGQYLEGKGRINFSVTGEGDAYIFRDGELIEGRWKKADRLARTKYYDKQGNEVEFNRGNTWVEIVPEGYGYSWQ
ncbi:MAG: DUF3048 domain-containing protein [Patescibacteria group bacterium]|jgi:hypothetical protein